jgi:hypothetical protein
VILMTCGLLAGCGSFAEIHMHGPSGESLTLNHAYFDAHAAEFKASGASPRLPLERALADSGYQMIDRVIFTLKGGEEKDFDWGQVADQTWLLSDGRVAVDAEIYEVKTIRAAEHTDLGLVEASILDLAPTAAQALGLRPPAHSEGQAIDVPRVDHVLLLFLDGFGYRRYEEALAADLIPNLAQLPDPLIGLTTYPPITTVATASMLTGAPPEVHGANRRGIRLTEIQTLFDVANQSGLLVKAVEGEALAFQLRGADFVLSGDRNGDGRTDDEVLENTLAMLEGGMPDLMLVHFHGIDDTGHNHGPGSVQESALVAFVDQAVGVIIAALPADTLVLIFADHGMHSVDEDGRLGNHGHLIPLDMLIPIIVYGT